MKVKTFKNEKNCYDRVFEDAADCDNIFVMCAGYTTNSETRKIYKHRKYNTLICNESTVI